MGRLRKFKPPKVSTVIGQAARVAGDLNFSGGLHLDGSVIGNVTGEPGGEATLTVSEQGRIEGDVRVDNLILNGTIIGDVYAKQRVELASKARVTGTVHYHLLEMAMGAEVNGQLVHAEELSASAQAPEACAESGAQDVPAVENAETANT
jgi:cytoskeletal protein CcmA (bactofilin family)